MVIPEGLRIAHKRPWLHTLGIRVSIIYTVGGRDGFVWEAAAGAGHNNHTGDSWHTMLEPEFSLEQFRANLPRNFLKPYHKFPNIHI